MKELYTSNCQSKIDGREVSELDFMRWELERSRVALALLKKKLGIAGLQELLRDETEESARLMDSWIAQSDGKYVGTPCEIEVTGCRAEEYLEWFGKVVAANDQETLDGACPEHYVVTPTLDRAMDVIETTGGYGLPSRFLVKLSSGTEASPDPSAIDDAYPIRMTGYGYQLDGRELGRVLHQFANTDKGFKAKLSIYFPAAAPRELIEGHKWHLVCEFTNWVNAFLDDREPQ